MTFTCPHCDEDFELHKNEIKDMEQNGYIINYECPICKNLMDIAVEMIWTGDAIIIENSQCDCCHRSYRKRNMHLRGSCYPYPVNSTYNTLCSDCYGKTMYSEMDDNSDAIASLNQEQIREMQNNYKPGDIVRTTIMQGPYHFSDTPRLLTVDKVDEHGMLWTTAPDGTIVKLCYGNDVFEKEVV